VAPQIVDETSARATALSHWQGPSFASGRPVTRPRISVAWAAAVVVSATAIVLVVLSLIFLGKSGNPAPDTPAVNQDAPAVSQPSSPDHSAPSLPLIAAVLVAAVIAASALAVAIRLVYWGRQLQGGQTSIVPNGLMHDWYAVRTALVQVVDDNQKIQLENQ
jgi:hypothetical protein